MLKELLLSIALQLNAGPAASNYLDLESMDEYKERLGVIAEAIAIESSPDVRPKLWKWDTESLAIAVLVTWWWESRFDLRVHQGVKHPRYSQDNGFARCLGQIHVGAVTKEEWKQLAGTDILSTRLCANATVKVISRWFKRCRYRRYKKPKYGQMIGIFGGYKTGRGCRSDKTANGRAFLWDTLYRTREEYLTLKD
jgi:hypothetical protein